MKYAAKVIVLALSPWLMAALWMDTQPSYRAYRAPAPPAPTGSVPVSGREAAGRQSGEPALSGSAALAQGKALFAINCAMCHGPTSAKPGGVGLKLAPPPPGLDRGMLQGLSDTEIFNALTLGFGRMPPFRDKLSASERRSLIAYLRTRD